MIKKPMRASDMTDKSKLRWPQAMTPKVDGIRCLRLDNKTMSRTFKLIKNQHIQDTMKGLINGLDGEIVTFNPDGSMRTFNEIQSDVMSEDGTPNFQYWVFDYVTTSLTEPYMIRMEKLGSLALPTYCKKLLPWIANNEEEMTRFEEQFLAQGFEGGMLRLLDGPYKCGKSTEREGFLLKLKRFKDSEAVIIGFEEQLENTNEAEKDAFGRTKRSKHQDNMVPKDTLGKFLVREIGDTAWKGQEFAVGTGKGLTMVLRQQIWDNKKDYLGKIITYKYQPHGTKDLPRIPIWKGFRDSSDIEE